jgi:serine/threonine protein phosphatase PrpC
VSDTKAGNVGSASHLGEKQVPRDAHFVYDYSKRRVPLPVVSYMGIADTPLESPGLENPAKKALDRLRDLIEPAVIAEEELNSPAMEALIKENLAKLNNEFFEEQVPEGGARPQASLTMVIADARRAYIGHVGTSRVYLLHGGRLYDLTPTGLVPPAPAPEPPPSTPESMTLFQDAQEQPAGEAPAAPAPPVKGTYLGQEAEANIGYNEVEISPGDVTVLVTDGLWRSVGEEELVENLLSAMNVQRSSSQLVRLAFSRDSSDNATMAAWQYIVGGEEEAFAEPRAAARVASRDKTRARAAEGVLVALLAVVLVGIFAVGFAFGWRITDTFRKPAKQKAKQEAAAKTTQPKTTQPQTTPSNTTPQTTQPVAPAPLTATVKGEGVRMRATPDPHGDLVGLLKNGEAVSVLADVTGTDSMAWTKVKGVVSSGGQNITAEGYVRNDFLVKSQLPPPATTPSGG